MNGPHRVAVIEVGSRAARLLIADVLPSEGLQNVCTNWKETGLREALEIGGSEAEARIAHLCNILKIFRAAAQEYRATRTAAFGTDAIRRLAPNQVRQLRAVFPDFKVLSRREEAKLSFLAGVMRSSEETRKSLVLVVDQGSGSMEVVAGTVVSGVLKVEADRSYSLGTTNLIGMLARDGSFARLRESVDKWFSKRRVLKPVPSGRPIVLGSAATSLAWIKVRGQNRLARYDPRQVQGRVIPIKDIGDLARLADSDSEAARLFIDPHHPLSTEYKTVVAGLVALDIFLRKHDKNEFEVCGDGTRYGLVWRLAMSQIDIKLKVNSAST